MIISGIDASTTCTGISYFKGNKLITYEKIDLKKQKNAELRMKDMYLQITSSLSKHKPDIVYYEDNYQKINPKTTKQLSLLMGAIWGYCILNDIAIEPILPSEWRTAIDINKPKADRKEYKRRAIDYVKENFGLDVGDDEADAICIGVVANLLET